MGYHVLLSLIYYRYDLYAQNFSLINSIANLSDFTIQVLCQLNSLKKP